LLPHPIILLKYQNYLWVDFRKIFFEMHFGDVKSLSEKYFSELKNNL